MQITASILRPRRVRHGFTLVELLVVISIVLVLAALSLGVFNKMTAKANNLKAISNMKQIGVAITAYMGENGHLPTFSDVGVKPALSINDPSTHAYVLQPYLGISEPTTIVVYPDIFQPPGLKPNNMGGRKYWYQVTCYAMYSADDLADTKALLPKDAVTDDEGETVGPFGRYVEGGTSVPGWRPAQIDAALDKFSSSHDGRISNLSMVPMMYDINAEHSSMKGGWPWPVPKKPIHGNHVNVLYFDGRVSGVDPKYLFTP